LIHFYKRIVQKRSMLVVHDPGKLCNISDFYQNKQKLQQRFCSKNTGVL